VQSPFFERFISLQSISRSFGGDWENIFDFSNQFLEASLSDLGLLMDGDCSCSSCKLLFPTSSGLPLFLLTKAKLLLLFVLQPPL